MNIIIITSGNLPMPPVRGGAVENLLEYYLKKNEEDGQHEIVVISSYDEEAQKASKSYKKSKFEYIDTNSGLYKCEKILYFLMNKFTNYNFGNAFIHKCINCIKNMHPDVILLENMPLFAIPLRKRFENIPIYLHLHNDTLNKETINSKKILDVCDGIWTVSNYINNRVSEIDENNSKKVVTLFNGTDSKLFYPIDLNEIKISLKKTYNIGENDFVLLYAGRIVPQKGVKELIEAFVQLRQKYDRLKLLIVGSSFFQCEKQGEFEKAMSKIAMAYKDDIIFTGYIHYDEMYKVYNIADVVVLPSLWNEPCALTVMEAIMCERPLITTNRGGIPEICRGTKSILLKVDEDLHKTLCDSISKLLENNSQLKKMSEACKNVKERLGIERYLKEFSELLLFKNERK